MLSRGISLLFRFLLQVVGCPKAQPVVCGLRARRLVPGNDLLDAEIKLVYLPFVAFGAGIFGTLPGGRPCHRERGQPMILALLVFGIFLFEMNR
jgi:hypothetical protein